MPHEDNPAIRKAFFSNLHAHKPQYRVKYERTQELRRQSNQQTGATKPEQSRTGYTRSNNNMYQPSLLYSPIGPTDTRGGMPTQAGTQFGLSPSTGTQQHMVPYSPPHQHTQYQQLYYPHSTNNPHFSENLRSNVNSYTNVAQRFSPSASHEPTFNQQQQPAHQHTHFEQTPPYSTFHSERFIMPPFQQQFSPPTSAHQPPSASTFPPPPPSERPWYYSGVSYGAEPPMPSASPNTQQPGSNSHSAQPATNTHFYPLGENSSMKKTRFFVQKVQCHSQRSTLLHVPLMPINIDNGFPNLTLGIGAHRGTVELTGLFDTCGSLNTGHLPFHMYIASQHPDAVLSVRFFNSDDPFEPIKLEGAVADPADYDASRHGLLTAVIQYKTPYQTVSGQHISLFIALGSDVSTNTIFGLPTLSAFEFLLNLKTLSAFSPVVHETFQLTRSAGSLGLPAGVQFDLSDLKRQYEAARVGLIVDGTAEQMDAADTAATSYVGIDDLSQGYLRRSVLDRRYLPE